MARLPSLERVLSDRLGRVNELVARLPEPIAGQIVVGAEVGVFRGKMSAQLLDARDDAFLYMVDSWLPLEEQPERYVATGDIHARLSAQKQAANHARALDVTDFARARRIVIPRASVVAASFFAPGALDFVFLDGDHSREGATEDLEAWMARIKSGGLLGGHDYAYAGRHRFGVREAVDAFSERHRLTIDEGADSTWFTVLP